MAKIKQKCLTPLPKKIKFSEVFQEPKSITIINLENRNTSFKKNSVKIFDFKIY